MSNAEQNKWIELGASCIAEALSGEDTPPPLYRIDNLKAESLPIVATLTSPKDDTKHSLKGAELLLDVVHQYWHSWLSFQGEALNKDSFNHHEVTQAFRHAIDEWKQLIFEPNHRLDENQIETRTHEHDCSVAIVIYTESYLFSYRIGDTNIIYLDTDDTTHWLFEQNTAPSPSNAYITHNTLPEVAQSTLIELDHVQDIELLMLASSNYANAFSRQSDFVESLFDFGRYLDVKGAQSVNRTLTQWIQETTPNTASLVLIKKLRPWYDGLQKAFERESVRLNSKINTLTVDNTRLLSEVQQLRAHYQQREKQYDTMFHIVESYRNELYQEPSTLYKANRAKDKKTGLPSWAIYSLFGLISTAGLLGVFWYNPMMTDVSTNTSHQVEQPSAQQAKNNRPPHYRSDIGS